MDVLIPLLYDTWLEVVPEDRQIKTNRGNKVYGIVSEVNLFISLLKSSGDFKS